MAEKRGGLLIHDRDNVAVVLDEFFSPKEDSTIHNQKGDTVFVLTVQNRIPFAHKIAVVGIKKGEGIIKYGEEIGKARGHIQAGEWVHTHNLYCERGYGNGCDEK